MVGQIVFDDHTQHHSVASTLPIHSAHSPLLADKTSFHHLRENQLSARYIHNTTFLCKKKKSAENCYIKSDINSSLTQISTNSTLSSKLLCYCEKSELEPPNNKISLDSVTPKRLVSKRNAATSPHLDVRKMGSMTTLAPSPSVTNELCMKTTECKINKLKTFSTSVISFSEEGSAEGTLEKNKSLNEHNALKKLRTARSLSPRPPIRHRHDMSVPDSSDVHVNFFRLPKANNRVNKEQKLCRSEQSSPNVVDETEMQFSYRSIGCMGNSYSDLWLKNMSFTKTAKEKNKLCSTKPESIDIKDPWIKRVGVESIPKISRHELFRQTKSFSGSKFDIKSSITDESLVNGTKSPRYLNGGAKPTSIIYTKNQLQSAPTSPQFLTAAGDNFSSSAHLTGKKYTGSFIEKTPKRSSSFSPAKIKHDKNSFADFNLHLTDCPAPIISFSTESIKERNKSNTRYANYEVLNVCNPNFSTNRHSFSSVNDQNQGEELQLNIRRLSDQLHRKEPVFTNGIKIFSSGRNVREKHKDEKKVIRSPNDTEGPINNADFSEYLKQFRCSEAKKSALHGGKTCFWTDKLLVKTTSNQQIVINKTQQTSDCLLETTC